MPDLVLYLLPDTPKLPIVSPDLTEEFIDVDYLVVGKIMVGDHKDVIVNCAVIEKVQ